MSSAPAAQAPETSALAAALAAAQQELASHELAEREAESSAVETAATAPPELRELSRGAPIASGIPEAELVSEPAMKSDNAKEVSSAAVIEGTDAASSTSVTVDGGESAVEKQPLSAEDTASQAVHFSGQQKSIPIADASEGDADSQPSTVEQHDREFEQQEKQPQGDLREVDGGDENAEAEAGGACKQS